MLRERDRGQFALEGAKSSGQEAHTPVEARNTLLSLSYAKVLIAVGEGQLAGNPTGKDIYLNGTPLINSSGEPNFGGVTWEWRDGSQDQSYIQGMPETSNETNVGVELTSTKPWTQLLTKRSLSAARVTLNWPALLEQKSNGDTEGYVIDYVLELSTDGGPFVIDQQHSVDGKTNTEYERTHTIRLPKNPTSGWSIRVRRITPDSDSSQIQDTMKIKSYTEVIDMKSRYPNTALLFVQFDSRLFGGGSIPTISVETKGRVIRVPSNYDAEQRTYSGVWAGDFKWSYTNNPAWVYYDILTNERFGLGSRVGAEQVDKFALYELAQYCDVMLDDGTGSGALAPRHTCNIFIQNQSEAWTVLRDLASIFNGMTYWNGNQFTILADKQEDLSDIALYSKSSVVNGKFKYNSTDERSIFTSALVSYDDPSNHYSTDIEAVWEKSEILRFGGNRQTTVSAIGCTSRAEAQRRGKYQLLTNLYNRGVTFQTGLQGLAAKSQPGKIIGVADPLIGGKPFTGRLISGTPTVVTLDRDTEAAVGDTLVITNSLGATQGRTIKSVNGRVIEVTVAYTDTPKGNAVWYLESATLKSQLFRVTKITSPSEGVYEITGVEYNDSKYGAIDNGARLESRPVSVVPPSVQAAPSPVTITTGTYIEQTMALTSMVINWPQTQYAVSYDVQWRVGLGDWVDLGNLGANSTEIKGVYAGNYYARVRAVNAMGTKSVWTTSAQTPIVGKEGAPPELATLTTTSKVFGIDIGWTFKDKSEDTAFIQIQESDTSTGTNARDLTTVSYPTNHYLKTGLAAGVQFFYRARLVDRTGNIGAYTGWVRGASSANADEILDYIKGQIDETSISKELNERINKIEVIESEVDALDTTVKALDGNVNWLESQLAGVENQIQNDISTVNKTLSDAITQTNNDVDNLKEDVADLNLTVEVIQNQVSNIVDALEYNPKAAYKKGDSVRLGQKLYQALKDVPVGLSPPNAEYWKDVGDIVTDLGALSAQVSTNSTTITQQGNTITAQGQQLNALDTRVSANEAGVKGNTTAINNLQTTVTQQGNTITSQGQAITAVTADVSSLKTGQSANASAIESLRTTVTQQGDKLTSQGQAITSLGSDLSALQTDVSGVKSEVSTQGTAINGLTTTVTQQGKDITSNSNNITSLENKVGTLTTDLSGLTTKVDANTTAVTNLSNTVTSQGNTITAQGRDITTLKADVSTVTTDVNGLKTTVSGQGTAISNLETKVTQQGNDISSISTNITKLQSDLQLTQLDQLYDKAETDQQITEALNIASGAASATQSLTSEVTKQGDVINAQGQLITELTASLTDVDGNIVGQAAAIESLKTQVTTQGNTITSQGSSITQLNNSLTLVDGKATNAQTAADKAQADATKALGQVATKAEAAAVTALTTRVTNAEGKITSQGESITQLNNSLVITNNNVTAAKKAADDAQKSADNALTQLTTKAEASAVTSLATRVTTVEGTVTSQGQSITQLNNSLDTTNQNVTAAQNAAQAASDKAGSKGEVIYGSTEPSADKRLSQNLWIDTTNNNNTPKRWNGSAWVAVTDKVATDAAKAAADASALAKTKADSSTVTALTNTVTQQGNTITAQGTAMTAIKATLDDTTAKADDALAKVATKAEAAAVNELKGTVTQQGKDIAANTSDITTLNTTVKFNELNDLYDTGEVDQQIASAIDIASGAALATQTLTSEVTRQGNLITANAQSLTELSSSLQSVNDSISANGTAIQRLTTTTTAQGNTLTQQGQSITSLTSSLAATDAKVALKADTTAVNTLSTKVDSIDGKVTAQGQSLTQLTTRVTNTETGVTSNATAISNTNTKVSEIDGKLTTVSTRVDGVYAQLNPRMAGSSKELAGNSKVLVGVWSEQSARIEGDVATGQRVDNVQVTVGENSAAIQETSKAVVGLDGKISSTWSVRLQVTSNGEYKYAGVGLGLENGPGGLQSTFIVDADKFAIGQGDTIPFAVANGQTFIKDAFIQNGSITMLKIGDALQSDDYVAGQTGWKLWKSGLFEINGNVAGQGRMTMTNRSLRVYDGNNIKRVQLGDLSE
mgnify:CR=1 FL=1